MMTDEATCICNETTSNLLKLNKKVQLMVFGYCKYHHCYIENQHLEEVQYHSETFHKV